jgi:hypothetical protein
MSDPPSLAVATALAIPSAPVSVVLKPKPSGCGAIDAGLDRNSARSGGRVSASATREADGLGVVAPCPERTASPPWTVAFTATKSERRRRFGTSSSGGSALVELKRS